jgi:hypothetical protein
MLARAQLALASRHAGKQKQIENYWSQEKFAPRHTRVHLEHLKFCTHIHWMLRI